MQEIDIFGTCFSRELFNTTDKYYVNTYLMQQSIFTMFSNPFSIESNEVISHDNYMFKNRMLYYEFNKLAIDKLKENHSKYIVIDLLDQVRKIYKIFNSSDIKIISTSDTKLTLENLKKIRCNQSITFEEEDVKLYSEQELYKYVNKFVKLLLSCYEEDKIIVNRAQLQNKYYNNDKLEYVNSDLYDNIGFIKRLEEILINLISNCRILYTRYDPILDINHRFGGPHPAHFEYIYYKYRMKILNDLIVTGGNFQKDIDNEYIKEYNLTINDIKKKSLII